VELAAAHQRVASSCLPEIHELESKMTEVTQKKQKRELDPKLAKVAAHLKALLSEHKLHGQEMQVTLEQDRTEHFSLVEVVHRFNNTFGELSLIYKVASGEKLSTGFTPNEAEGIRIRKNGIFGTDFDGEWVRVVGSCLPQHQANQK